MATSARSSHGIGGDVGPMSDRDLFRLECEVRCARNGRRCVALEPRTVLSLICEAWYLRSLLGKPAEELDAALAKDAIR